MTRSQTQLSRGPAAAGLASLRDACDGVQCWIKDREGRYRRLRTYVLGEFDPQDEYSSYSAERKFAQLMGDKRYEDWYTPDVLWRGAKPATYVASEAST